MLIQWITIAEFRSYRSLSFSPAPGLNVLSGPNAQGKTNLLEAMGLLLVGRSFRGAKPVDLTANCGHSERAGPRPDGVSRCRP